jgi:AcrR family transcriptional regulator
LIFATDGCCEHARKQIPRNAFAPAFELTYGWWHNHDLLYPGAKDGPSSAAWISRGCMMRAGQAGGTLGKQSEPAEAILDAFAARAKRLGIRAIIIEDIARDLGMSKKTIYQYFRSKEEMVAGLVQRWHKRLDAPIPGGDPVEIMRDWVVGWNDNNDRYSHEFWSELAADYPRLQQQYLEHVTAKKRMLARQINPLIKPGIRPRFAWECYSTLLDAARRPEFQRAVSLSKQEALLAALDIWIGGVLDLPTGRKPRRS